MSFLRSIRCNGCGTQLSWHGRPTQAHMNQKARDTGWNAPDKAGRHWCPDCRSRPREAG